MNNSVVTLAVVPLLLASSLSTARGEEGKQCPCYGEERRLKGHLLLEPVFVESPLVITNTGVRAGLEGELIPNLPIGPREVDVDVLSIVETYDLSLAWQNRFAFFLSLGGVASFGSDGQSLLLRGSEYALGGDGGLKAKLYRDDDAGLLVSAQGSGGYSAGTLYDVASLAVNVAASEIDSLAEIDLSSIPESFSTEYWQARGALSVSAALVITHFLSLQTVMGIRYLRQKYDVIDFASGEDANLYLTRWTPRFGVAVTVDGAPLGVSAALLFEYVLSYPFTDNELRNIDDSDAEHRFSLGLFYTGRQDLQLGVVGFVRVSVAPIPFIGGESDAPTPLGGAFVLRTYW